MNWNCKCGEEFVKRVYFMCTSSAQVECSEVWWYQGQSSKIFGQLFLRWTLQSLQTEDLFRDAGLTEENGHSAPWMVAPMTDAETRIACTNDGDEQDKHL